MCNTLETRLEVLGAQKGEDIIREYEKNLFKKNKVSTFSFPNGDLLTGMIKGITPAGLLKVMEEDETLKLYDLKEIKLLF